MAEQPNSTSVAKDNARWTTSNPPPLTRKIINYISGGFTCRRIFSSTRKRNYRTMLTLEGEGSRLHQPTCSTPSITFQASDFKSQTPNLDDLVVILVTIRDTKVRKVLMDPGSSADVLFLSTFQKMQLNKNTLQPSSEELVGFSGERVLVTGYDDIIATIHSDHKGGKIML
ncbi:uncharacterized protein [Arachis hypogaea]|uniref:uncharacterized protein n=1 Tax=Arachis hypogaea TaxID=3818 RepID=UPI003B2135B1